MLMGDVVSKLHSQRLSTIRTSNAFQTFDVALYLFRQIWTWLDVHVTSQTNHVNEGYHTSFLHLSLQQPNVATLTNVATAGYSRRIVTFNTDINSSSYSLITFF